MKSLIVLLGFALLIVNPVFAQSAGGKREYDVAMEIFRRNVAASFKMKEADLQISPVMEDYQAEAPYEGLKTGAMWPFWALKKDGVTSVARGFASADGQVAFLRYKAGINQPGELADLLSACRVLDRRKRMEADEVAARLLWCLDTAKTGISEHLFDAKEVKALGWTPPKTVRKAEYRAQKTGVMLIYFTMTQGNTGTVDFHKVSVTVLPNFETIVHREDVKG
jgi:hypothetical protein